MSDPVSTDNSETVSEKPKRGRRPAFEPMDDAIIFSIYSDRITTKRSIRNKQYSILGLRAIRPNGVDKPNQRHDWFAGTGKNYRQAILVELGRIALRFGNAIAAEMADGVADGAAAGDFTTTREAVSWLHRARLSASKPVSASADALAQLVISTVANYLVDHPDAGGLVEEALYRAMGRLGV